MDDSTKFCQICGGTSARKTYGVIACGSCRIFFIRSSRRKDKFQCKFYKNCLISTLPRMNCTACRFQKCIEAGMLPAEVGKNDQKQKTVVHYISSLHYKQVKTELSMYLLPSGLSNISRLQNATTATEFADILFRFEKLFSCEKLGNVYFSRTINLAGESASDFPVNLNLTLVDILMNPTLCATRDSASWDARDAINPNKRYYFHHTYCRFATYLADFLSSIPEYHFLSSKDKIKLFQSSFSLNTMSALFYSRFRIKYNRVDVKKRISRFNLSESDKESYSKFLGCITKSFDSNIKPQFEEIQLTDQEWILLKVICIFSSINSFSDDGSQVIHSTKINYCSILGKLIDELYPYFTQEEKASRLGKILSTPPAIIKHTGISNQFYSAFVSENKGGLKGALSYDIHMRQF